MLFKLCVHRVLAMLLPALVVVLLLLVGDSVNASCISVAILKYLQA
jgi:hypothetical protein